MRASLYHPPESLLRIAVSATAVNHERYEEEARRGLHKKKGKKGKREKTTGDKVTNGEQMALL